MAQTAAPPLLPVFRSCLQGELLALVLGAPAAEWTAEDGGDLHGVVPAAVPRLGQARAVTSQL
ncbi:MAG: hypothetical protein ACRDP7_45245, partial [Trebonia sp.]